MNREKKVAFFNKIMGQPINSNPNSVSLKMRQLGIRIIFEELKELALASDTCATFKDLCETFLKQLEEGKKIQCGDRTFNSSDTDGDNVNEVLQIDALCDVQYTNSWAVNVFGHSEIFEEGYNRTCKSNDTKACNSMEEALETKAYWENPETPEGGVPHIIDTVVSDEVTYYVVKRESDGKVRKSINYTPADFKSLFEK